MSPYDIPSSHRTFGWQDVPFMHYSVVEVLKAQLSRMEGWTVHFTADQWSNQQYDYLSLTMHWWQLEDLQTAK